MSSLTRAVTARLNEFAHGRQRLTADAKFEGPGKVAPSSSESNFIIPPAIIWEEFPTAQQEPAKCDPPVSENEQAQTRKSSPSNFSQKMTAVVRKLSPFNEEAAFSNLDKSAAKEVDGKDESKRGPLKETKARMEKLKKLRRTKDRQQLIDSDDDE